MNMKILRLLLLLLLLLFIEYQINMCVRVCACERESFMLNIDFVRYHVGSLHI